MSTLHLLYLAVVIGIFLLLFVVSTFEKQKVREMAAIPRSELKAPSPYFLTTSESVERMGFQFVEMFKQDRKSWVYRAYMGVWISPDRRTLAHVISGTTSGIGIKRTRLVSCLKNGRFLESTDMVGRVDVSGLTEKGILYQAKFEELYRFHQDRLAERADELLLFSPATAGKFYDVYSGLHANYLVENGLARYIDANRTMFRYTVKGAMRIYGNYQSEQDSELKKAIASKSQTLEKK